MTTFTFVRPTFEQFVIVSAQTTADYLSDALNGKRPETIKSADTFANLGFGTKEAFLARHAEDTAWEQKELMDTIKELAPNAYNEVPEFEDKYISFEADDLEHAVRLVSQSKAFEDDYKGEEATAPTFIRRLLILQNNL